jgi:hypothetical protein
MIVNRKATSPDLADHMGEVTSNTQVQNTISRSADGGQEKRGKPGRWKDDRR